VYSSDDWWECDEALRIGCSSKAKYQGTQVPSTNVTVLDDDNVGITVGVAKDSNATYSNFGDALTSAVYTLALSSEPSSPVVVTMSGLTSFASAVPSTVSFTAANWDVPVTIKVVARAPLARRPVCLSGNRFCDAIQNRTEIVVHTVTSLDQYYSNLAVDSTSISVTAVYDKADPPKTTLGRFVNLLNAIQITFNSDTNRAGFSGSFACTRILDITAAMARHYFGYQHFCSFTSKTVLKITFGKIPQVLSGAEFALKDLTVQAFAKSSTLFTTNETFIVRGPLIPTIPVTSLTASSEFVGLCDGLVLDGSGSRGSGGRDMTYNYSVASVIGDVSNISRAFAAANAGSGQRSIILNSGLMSPGSVFRVTLRTTNFIGFSHSVTSRIEKLGWPAPILSVQGSNPRTAFYSSSLSLQVNAALPSFVCASAEFSGTKLSFSWKEVTGHFNGLLSGTSKNPRVLSIPAGSLEAGLNYTFIATGWMTNDPSLNNTASVVVEVAYQDLIAVIDGGVYRQVGESAGFSLNGRMSYDPDDSVGDLSYSWGCNASSASASCDGVNLLEADSVDVASRALEVGKYSFSLTVSKGKRSASTSTTIEILSGSPPVVEATPLTQKKYNLDSGFVKVSSASAQSALPVTTTWSTEDSDVDDIFKSKGSSADQVKNMRQTVVQLSVLTEGFTYTLKLAAVDTARKSSYTTITFTMNEAPSSGSLTVSPLTGWALSTYFAFSAKNWVDDDLPLTYVFGTVAVNSNGSLTTALTPFGDSRSDCFWNDVMLAQGDEATNYTVGTFVRVIDSYGAAGEYATLAHVKNQDLTLDQLLNASRTQSNSALDTGSADTARQVILATALGLKTSEVTSGGRRSLLATSSATSARAALLEDLWSAYELTEITESEVASLFSVLDGIVDTPSEISAAIVEGSLNFISTVLRVTLGARVGLSEIAADYISTSLESLFRTEMFNNSYGYGSTSLDHIENVSTIFRLASTALLIDAYDGIGYSMDGDLQEVEIYSYRSSVESLSEHTVSLSDGSSDDTITSAYFNGSLVDQIQAAASLNASSTLDVFVAIIKTNILAFALHGTEGSATATASRADQAATFGIILLRSYLTVVEVALADDPHPLSFTNITSPIAITLRANVKFNTNFTEFGRVFSCSKDRQVVTIDCPLAPINHTCDFSAYGGGEKYFVDFVCPYVAPICLRWQSGERNFSSAGCIAIPGYANSEVTCECSYQSTSTIFVLSGNLTDAKMTALQTPEPTPSPSPKPTPAPSHEPTPRPTQQPTVSPTASQLPTHRPTLAPSPFPTTVPSVSNEPTPLTWIPSVAPVPVPTAATPIPTVPFPTPVPSMPPTADDTVQVITSFNIIATKAPSEAKEYIVKAMIASGIGLTTSNIKAFSTSVIARRLLEGSDVGSSTGSVVGVGMFDLVPVYTRPRELATSVTWEVTFTVQSSTSDAATVSASVASDLAASTFTSSISSSIAGATVDTSSIVVVVVWTPTKEPTPLPSPQPTPQPTQCLDEALFCEATIAFCNVSYCKICPYAGLCDRTWYVLGMGVAC
jgi:hypothetical protein